MSADQALLAAFAHHQAGRLDEADQGYRAVLAEAPWHPVALHLAGVVAQQRGRHAEAVDLISRAIGLDPRPPEFHLNLGTALQSQGLFAAAEQCFAKAAELDPRLPEAHYNRALALRRMGRPERAEASARRAVALRPRYPQALCTLSAVLSAQRRYAEAIAAAQSALAVEPRHVLAHTALAEVCRRTGDAAGARAWCERALSIAPDDADARAMLGVLLLLCGDFDAGWREYEWRWRTAGPGDVLRRFTLPAWDGSPLAGRTVLLWADQGLGDAIQFVRFAPLVKARGGRVVVECPAGLVALFRTASAVDEVCAFGSPPPFDVHCPLTSLPFTLGTGAETPGTPYLSAAADRTAAWAQRLGPRDGRLRVGLVWAGSAINLNDRNRSLALADLLPVLRVPGVRFVSLQFGPAVAQLAAPGIDVTDCSADLTDMAATAAALSQLDLLVTIDSAVAHLAGATGLPVWILVPFAPDWRWGLGGRDSRWYPSARLFRQSRLGDWSGPVTEAASELATLAPADR
jgi:Flp pilus assembly protein TadD